MATGCSGGYPPLILSSIGGVCTIVELPEGESLCANLGGPQGPTGETGPCCTGATGGQGSPGNPGATGGQGNPGATGGQGSQGNPGIQGNPGEQGSTGPQGEQGPTGAQGEQGPSGDTGLGGMQGEPGLVGVQGVQGVQGPSGDTGLEGSPGLVGSQGVQGPSGPQGPDETQFLQNQSGWVQSGYSSEGKYPLGGTLSVGPVASYLSFDRSKVSVPGTTGSWIPTFQPIIAMTDSVDLREEGLKFSSDFLTSDNFSGGIGLTAYPKFTNTLEWINNADMEVSGNVTVSGNLSAIDSDGDAFVFRRDDGESYKNLIKSYEGTIVIQPEDDIHFRTNGNENMARFNEDGAVWLYEDGVKKLETAPDGVYVSGMSKTSEGFNTSTLDSVAVADASLPALSDFRIPHGAGAFWWASSTGDGTTTDAEVKFGEGTTVGGVSSVGRSGASNTDGYYLWDETNDKVDVSATGIYRVVWNAACNVNTNTNSIFKIYVNGAEVYTQTYRLHTVTDPHLVALDWVGPVTAGVDAIYVTALANSEGTITLTINSASTLFVQRLA